jgi:hypothetical protein
MRRDEVGPLPLEARPDGVNETRGAAIGSAAAAMGIDDMVLARSPVRPRESGSPQAIDEDPGMGSRARLPRCCRRAGAEVQGWLTQTGGSVGFRPVPPSEAMPPVTERSSSSEISGPLFFFGVLF